MNKIELELDAVECVARLGSRSEALSSVELQLLELFLSYREQSVYRHSMTDVVRHCGLQPAEGYDRVADRVVDQAVARLIRKTLALHPEFPLIRRLGRDEWRFSVLPPPKRKPSGSG